MAVLREGIAAGCVEQGMSIFVEGDADLWVGQRVFFNGRHWRVTDVRFNAAGAWLDLEGW